MSTESHNAGDDALTVARWYLRVRESRGYGSIFDKPIVAAVRSGSEQDARLALAFLVDWWNVNGPPRALVRSEADLVGAINKVAKQGAS